MAAGDVLDVNLQDAEFESADEGDRKEVFENLKKKKTSFFLLNSRGHTTAES